MYSETAVSVGLGLMSFIFAYLAVNRQANDGVKVSYLFSCFFMMIAQLFVLTAQATTDNQTAVANTTALLMYIPATIVILMFLYYMTLLLLWSFDSIQGKNKKQDDEL
jgi:hypothetical protein